MAYSVHANFALSAVVTPPSPATSGTSLTVTAGQGALFPTPPFPATVWPANSQATSANAEIVSVTNIATDTFTIVRMQEGTSAVAIAAGYQIAQTITAKVITDIQSQVTEGNYGGAAPNFTPVGNCIATDNVTGREWKYWGGAWH